MLDTIQFKKRIMPVILWIAGYGIIALLVYAGILSLSNASNAYALKAVLITYSIFAIPVIYSFLTARSGITNHTLHYKGISPSMFSFKKTHTIQLADVSEINTGYYGRSNEVLIFKMSDGSKLTLRSEYFLKKELFHALNHSYSSAIVPDDSASKFSIRIHPVTGLFSGSLQNIEICINGQSINCDSATGVFQLQARHGDLISIRRGDNFVFRFLDELEDVDYVLDSTELIKTRPEDIETTVKLKRTDNFLMVVFVIVFLVAIGMYENKAKWGLLVIPLMWVISKLWKRKK